MTKLANENDIKIRPQTPQEKERLSVDADTPEYRIKLDLSDEQKERLLSDFFEEFEGLKEERKNLMLEEKWKERQRQYDGEVKYNARMLFNLHTHQSRIKVDAIVRACNEAFLDSDPKFEVTPRPDFTGKNGDVIAEKQTDYLDFTMDEEIKPDKEFTRIFRSSAMKYVGLQKLEWAYRRQPRKREETYIGKNEMTAIGANNVPVMNNEGLREFLNNYPDAFNKYPALVKRLADGKEINVVVEYLDTVENNGKLRNVKVEDFYVKNSVDSNDALRTTHLIVERQSYSWWELLQKERNEEFENVEELRFQGATSDQEQKGEFQNYKTRDYAVLEATYYFKLNPDDEEETKIKAWFSEDRKTYLGAILYPYYGFDCDYKAYWMTDNGKGFYGDSESVMWTLRDSNIAQNALLNLALHGTYARNIITPILKEGSEIEQQILDNKWVEGLPLIVDEETDDVSKAVGFMQYPVLNVGELVNLVSVLKQQDGDITGVSGLMTGRESPTDPSAPAAKTIALLQQSGINIKDYIRQLRPSFEETAGDILQLYYQMSNQGRKFKVRTKSRSVTGANPFETITRDEMIAKTTIQSRAGAFAFDKINEKQENLAMMQILYANPIALQRPKLLYKALLVLMKSWSPLWKNLADTALPGPDEFALEQRGVAIQAITDFVSLVKEQEKITGVQAQFDINRLTQIIAQAQQASVVPPMENEVSSR